MEHQSLTPEEREWAFALEEALYEYEDGIVGVGNAVVSKPKTSPGGNNHANNGSNNTATGGRATRIRGAIRRRGSSIHNSIRGNITNNNNNYYNNGRARTDLYGRPSDLELAAHAIVSKGNIPRALKRLSRIQAFRNAYGLDGFDSSAAADPTNGTTGATDNRVETVLLGLRKFLLAYPEFLQSVGLDNHGRITALLRLEGLRWSSAPPFNHTETDRFRGLYYLLCAVQPTLDSIRGGTVWITDLMGVSEAPTMALLNGCRMLLRDSYPMRVEDLPVVGCPPRFSKPFVSTYPFWSRHFASRFVRVSNTTLVRHFPRELLNGGKLRTTAAGGGGPPPGRGRRKRRQGGGGAPGSRTNNATPRNAGVDVDIVVAANGDEYDNTWENLDDDDEFELETLERIRDGTVSGTPPGAAAAASGSAIVPPEYIETTSPHDRRGANGADGRTTTTEGTTPGREDNTVGTNGYSEDLLTTLERLLRMRFETEASFRLV